MKPGRPCRKGRQIDTPIYDKGEQKMKKHSHLLKTFLLTITLLLVLSVAGCNKPKLGTPIPEFLSNNIVVFTPIEGATHYEFRIEDEILQATVPQFEIPRSGTFFVRAIIIENDKIIATGDWSDPIFVDIENHEEDPNDRPGPHIPNPDEPDEPKDPPIVTASIDNLGYIQFEVSNYDNRVTYWGTIRYEDGEEAELLYQGRIRLRPNVPATLTVKTNYKVPTYSDPIPVIYEIETIVFDQNTNPISLLQKTEDGSYLMVATSSSGKEYTFRLDGEITPVENGWGALTPGSRFYSLDAVHGATYLDYSGLNGGLLESYSIGYELDGNDRIQTYDDMDIWFKQYTAAEDGANLDTFPNFFCLFNNYEKTNDPVQDAATTHYIESFAIRLNGTESVFDHATTHEYFYHLIYLQGSPFSTQNLNHFLQLYFRNGDQIGKYLDISEDAQFVALLDKDGNIIEDVATYYMQEGDMARLQINGSLTVDVPIVKESYKEAANSNEARPNSFSDTIGTMNVLVVPIYLKDQADRATDKNMDMIYRALGNIIDTNGNVTTYVPLNATEPSLSAYYQAASFGNLTVNSFVTDWYLYDANSDEIRNRQWELHEYDQFLNWIKTQYPSLDLSRFDNDRDGIIDEIILINTLDMEGYDSYDREGISGAHRTTTAYGGNESPSHGTPENPMIHHYVNMTLGFLFDSLVISETENIRTEVLIHEFGHTLGLWDYYDTSQSGIAALGGYDMMDQNIGDWNVYSKFTAGWISPTVVTKSDFSQSNTLEFTIRSSALTGDALLIPSAGYDYNGTPFDEYLMIDLFTPEGLHQYDSKEYGLENAVGVRIYHVNDRLQLKTTPITDETCIVFGMQTFTNSANSPWSEEFDMHQIEIISSTGKNHFTSRSNPYADNTPFCADDLFFEGDTFDAETFTEFFHRGKMDNGMDFGYTVTVKSIDCVNGEYLATIAVTRN